MICYQRLETRFGVQECYETASRDAGKRAKELRKLGFTVSVSSMGSQVTNVGTVRLTSLTVILPQMDVPKPERMERI